MNVNSYSISYNVSTNKRKKPTLIKFLAAVSTILIFTLFLTALFSFIGFGENSSNFTEHKIRDGESLWSIAAQYHDTNNIDLRKIIYEIKNINDIDSSIISPGKKLIIPLN